MDYSLGKSVMRVCHGCGYVLKLARQSQACCQCSRLRMVEIPTTGCLTPYS